VRVDRPPPGEELNTGEVTKARDSASLILLRDSPDGPEVLLVRRNPEQRFMGGAWVFPGGATHGEDADEEATARRELAEEASIALPAESELVRYSRWITPAQVKVRFDTHFFVARAPEGAEPQVDGSECVAARWMRPREALEAGARDELMLVFPTIKHLEQLAEHASVDEALEWSRGCWWTAASRRSSCRASRATTKPEVGP
jgi:8-oxo-dGTP pyrophosphatase MutT (NUDIX family)